MDSAVAGLVEIEREDWTHKMQRLLRRACCHATRLLTCAQCLRCDCGDRMLAGCTYI
jgi:hypothetical protein